MLKIRSLICIAALAVAGVACGSDPEITVTETSTPPATTSSPATTNEALITAADTATVWTNANPTISTGGTVKWSWDGSLPHNVVAADNSYTSGEAVNKDEFERTFTAAGEYVYYCEIHGTKEGSGMAGRITVV